MVLTLAAAIFVLGILVLVHELGHFVTAKMTGMRVDEFSIGFGPVLASMAFGETLYSLRCIPLGGYNSIAGMLPEENDAGVRGFCERPILSRMIVMLAGAAMNLILPIVIFFGIYATVGVTTVSPEPVFGKVMEGQPAAEAGLLAGDRVLAVDGREVTNWTEFTRLVAAASGSPVTLNIARGGEQLTATMTPRYNAEEKRMLIGVTSATVRKHPGPVEAAGLAVQQTGNIIHRMLDNLYRVLLELSGQDLAGPIGVAQMAGQVAERGLIPLLNFMAFLSLNLGIVNLIPIPALDGGRVVVLFVEAVRGEPLGTRSLAYLQYVGVAFLLLLMILATKNDVVRVFLGG